MSSKRNDGGPAFPIYETPGIWAMGLSVRDYFAAQAMQAIVSCERLTYPPDGPGERSEIESSVALRVETSPETVAEVAFAAYQIADAMLAERSK